MSLTLYLAGPGVFRPDAIAYGQQLKARCAHHGFEGLFPLDAVVPEALDAPTERGAWIYRANIELIRRADAVLADLNSFRGAEPDSGTSFEVGYAVALGKPVYGYLQDAGSYRARLQQQFPGWCGEGESVDRDGLSIEDFGLPLNLMLAVPCRIVAGGIDEALAVVAQEQGAIASRAGN